MVNTIIRSEKIKSFCPMSSDFKSPFAVFENEEIIVNPVKQPSHAFPLRDIDKILVDLCNTYLLLTSEIAFTALLNLGVDITKKDVQSRLKSLTDAEYLTQMEFRTQNGCSSAKYYKLGRRGAGFLMGTENKRVNKSLYLSGLDATSVKKVLSTLQYIVRTDTPVENICMAEPCFVPNKDPNKRANKIFRSQCVIQNKSGTIFVESVRRNKGYLREFIDKLERINSVVSSPRKNIKCYYPELVVIAEDQKHMAAIAKAVNKEYLKPPIPIKYTCDRDVYNDPSHCLVSFVEQSFFDFLFP